MVVIFHRGLRISSRHLFLTLGDWLIIVLSQLAAVFLRLGFEEGGDYLLGNWGSLASAVAIYMLVFYAGGMYEPPARSRRLDFDFLPLVVTGIGLSNTRSRLEQLYPGRFEFRSAPEAGGRWITRLALPLTPLQPSRLS